MNTLKSLELEVIDLSDLKGGVTEFDTQVRGCGICNGKCSGDDSGCGICNGNCHDKPIEVEVQ